MKLSFSITVSMLMLAATCCAEPEVIKITTAHTAFVLAVGSDGRLYELGYGSIERIPSSDGVRARDTELYPQYGDGFIWEPALEATHIDGNTSTDLIFQRQQTQELDTNVTLTRIELKDSYYPFYVTLCFKSYRQQDMIEQWAEIRNGESGTVVLHRYDSSAPTFKAKAYWLTQFHGNYQHEATLDEEKLGPGIKILDSNLGVRATRFCLPSFILSLNGPAHEEKGAAIGGSLAWSGSFQLAFEVTPDGRLRVLCGINPLGEEYHLQPGATLKTPAMLWTWSDHGKGQVSRNFDDWARRYGIRDGAKPRPVLLNNWEATGFNFDQKTIISLFKGAKEIGADLFLLDDGWFGNAYPRNNDDAGLGDWQVNTNKLPDGLAYLAKQAHELGLHFGIWIEPEMVNPHSDLFKEHPDWAIQQPHRPFDTNDYGVSRNQLDLDLSRPAVQQFVWQVLDKTLGISGVNYVKWDANRYVTQPGSTYLPPNEQSQLLVDYNFALYGIMADMTQKYPDVMAMLCSGGGGRVDYGALKYFDEYWPSDNTDPLHRVFIQWGFSHFFPAEAIAAHITRMGNRPLKFAIDVAMSGTLGVDMDLSKLNPAELRQLAGGIALYKREIRDIVEQGELYRLESPYTHPRAALDYVSPDRSRAVLFVYQVEDAQSTPVRPQGLDSRMDYLVREVDLPEGVQSQLAVNGRLIDGATLMREGILPPCQKKCSSAVVELIAQKLEMPAQAQ